MPDFTFTDLIESEDFQNLDSEDQDYIRKSFIDEDWSSFSSSEEFTNLDDEDKEHVHKEYMKQFYGDALDEEPDHFADEKEKRAEQERLDKFDPIDTAEAGLGIIAGQTKPEEKPKPQRITEIEQGEDSFERAVQAEEAAETDFTDVANSVLSGEFEKDLYKDKWDEKNFKPIYDLSATQVEPDPTIVEAAGPITKENISALEKKDLVQRMSAIHGAPIAYGIGTGNLIQNLGKLNELGSKVTGKAADVVDKVIDMGGQNEFTSLVKKVHPIRLISEMTGAYSGVFNETGTGTTEHWENKLTAEEKRKLDGKWTEEDTTLDVLQSLVMKSAVSAPETVAIGMAGSPVAGSLMKAAPWMTKGLTRLGASQKAAKGISTWMIEGLGYGTVEGMSAGLSAARDVNETIDKMSHEELAKSSQTYRDYLEDNGGDAAKAKEDLKLTAELVTVGTLSGTFATLGPLTGGGLYDSKVLTSPVRLFNSVLSGGKEAWQEFWQSSMGEQLPQNLIAMKYYKPDQQIWEGVKEAGVEGSGPGFMMGLVGGAGGTGTATQRTAADAEQDIFNATSVDDALSAFNEMVTLTPTPTPTTQGLINTANTLEIPESPVPVGSPLPPARSDQQVQGVPQDVADEFQGVKDQEQPKSVFNEDGVLEGKAPTPEVKASLEESARQRAAEASQGDVGAQEKITEVQPDTATEPSQESSQKEIESDRPEMVVGEDTGKAAELAGKVGKDSKDYFTGKQDTEEKKIEQLATDVVESPIKMANNHISKAKKLMAEGKVEEAKKRIKMARDMVDGAMDKADTLVQADGQVTENAVNGAVENSEFTKISQEINDIESQVGEAGKGQATPAASPQGEGQTVSAQGDAGQSAPNQKTHDYSNTQIQVKGKVAKEVKSFGQKIPDTELYTEENDDSYGREEEPHVTVRYGLETDNPADLKELGSLPPITVKTGKVSIFETDKYDVVKVDVESDSLTEANKKVGEIAEVPGETFKEYTPHITIAYVKKGEGKKYVGDSSIEGQEITVDTINLSSRDGKMHEIKLEGKQESPVEPPSREAEQQDGTEATEPAATADVAEKLAEQETIELEPGKARKQVEDAEASVQQEAEKDTQKEQRTAERTQKRQEKLSQEYESVKADIESLLKIAKRGKKRQLKNLLDRLEKEHEADKKSLEEGHSLEARGRKPEKPHTEASFKEAAREALNGLQEGLGDIVDDFHYSTQAEVAEAVDIYTTDDEVVQAFFNPEDASINIIPENIPNDISAEELVGLFRHEISVHALRMGKDSKALQDIYKELNRLKETDALVQEAYASIPENTEAEFVDEEALGYLQQLSPDHSLVQRFLRWFRGAIRNITNKYPSLKETGLGKWANQLTVEDLQQLANDVLLTAKTTLPQVEPSIGGIRPSTLKEKGIDILNTLPDDTGRGISKKYTVIGENDGKATTDRRRAVEAAGRKHGNFKKKSYEFPTVSGTDGRAGEQIGKLFGHEVVYFRETTPGNGFPPFLLNNDTPGVIYVNIDYGIPSAAAVGKAILRRFALGKYAPYTALVNEFAKVANKHDPDTLDLYKAEVFNSKLIDNAQREAWGRADKVPEYLAAEFMLEEFFANNMMMPAFWEKLKGINPSMGMIERGATDHYLTHGTEIKGFQNNGVTVGVAKVEQHLANIFANASKKGIRPSTRKTGGIDSIAEEVEAISKEMLESGEFKRWFKDSFFHLDGKPFMLWHGTPEGKSDFLVDPDSPEGAWEFRKDVDPARTHDSNETGLGHYFDTRESAAWGYAGWKGTKRPFYLSIPTEKVLQIDSTEMLEFDTVEEAEAFAKRHHELNGYDAIYHPDTQEVIVFKEATGSIKSAEYNTGKFDRTRKDTRFAVRKSGVKKVRELLNILKEQIESEQQAEKESKYKKIEETEKYNLFEVPAGKDAAADMEELFSEMPWEEGDTIHHVKIHESGATLKQKIANVQGVVQAAINRVKDTEGKIPAVTFVLPDGTEFTVLNTVKTLKQFKALVPRIYKPLARAKKAFTTPSITKKAHKQYYWGERLVTIEGDTEWVGDGGVMVKGVKAPKKKFEKEDVIDQDTRDALLRQHENASEAEIKYYTSGSQRIDEAGVVSDGPVMPVNEKDLTEPVVIIQNKDTGQRFVYSQNKLNIIKNAHPNATFSVTKDGLVFAEVNGDVVGMIMRQNYDDAKYVKNQDMAKASGLYSMGRFADNPVVMNLPELVELAKELLGGKYPRLISKFRKRGVLGQFWPKGSGEIDILRGLGGEFHQALKTLAHEIGHLVDYLDDRTMSRGNILGRIASLKGYMKHFLEEKPGSPGVITDEDRKRLRKEAKRILQEGEQYIDEIIEKEIPVTPDDVLGILKGIELDPEPSADVISFIFTASTAVKKSLAMQAMKGLSPKEMEHLKTITKEKTGKQVKKEITKDEIYQKYKELVAEEVAKRKLFQRDVISAELKLFTQLWKPFDEWADKKYTQYRHSSVELYADALSGLMTDPEMVKRVAPNFYEAFFNYIDSKPEASKIWGEIADRIHLGKEEVSRKRVQGDYETMKKAAEIATEKAKNRKTRGFWDTLRLWLDDKNHMINKVLRKLEKDGGKSGKKAREAINEIRGIQYVTSEVDQLMLDFNERIQQPADEAGISLDDMGVVALRLHIISNRKDIFSTKGYTPETAQEDLNQLKKDWGAEKFNKTVELVRELQRLREEIIYPLMEESGLYNDDLLKLINETTDYSKVSVLKYLEEKHGSGTTARIYKQVGTLDEIDNPITATVMQDISIIRAARINLSKRSVIPLLWEAGALEPAKLKWDKNTESQQPIQQKDPNKAILSVMMAGKPYHFYTSIDIADAYKYNPAVANGVAKVWAFLSRPVREILISKNPVWMARNPWRDFRDTVKKNPEIRLRHVPTLLNAYRKAFREAMAEAYKGTVLGKVTGARRSEVIRHLMRNRALTENRVYDGLDHDLETDLHRMQNSFRLSTEADKQRNIAIRGFKALYEYVDNLGRAMEIISKIAGYKFLRENLKMSDKEALDRVRGGFVGTPDFKTRGSLHSLFNNLFIFSNIGKEGIKTHVKSAMDDPGQYAWKTMLTNIMPKAMLYFAGKGVYEAMFGDGDDDEPVDWENFKWEQSVSEQIGGTYLQRLIAGIPEYDISHYTVIPLGMTYKDKVEVLGMEFKVEGMLPGKSVYLRIPEDYEGQGVGALAWKLMNNSISGIGSALSELDNMHPYSIHPWLNVAAYTREYYFQGKNPVDNYRGRPIISDKAYRVGGLAAAKELGKAAWREIGGATFYNPKYDNLERERSGVEEFLNSFGGNVIGSFIKMSDRGIQEKFMAEFDKLDTEKAHISMKIDEELSKLSPVEKLMVYENVKDQNIKRKLKRQFLMEQNTAYSRALAAANTKEKQAIVIDAMMKEFLRGKEE